MNKPPMTQAEIDAEQEILRQQAADPKFNFSVAAEVAPEISDEETQAVTPLDLLNSNNYTTRATRDARLDTCKGCDRLFRPTKSCRECGCFMGLKTWLAEATCPLGKW